MQKPFLLKQPICTHLLYKLFLSCTKIDKTLQDNQQKQNTKVHWKRKKKEKEKNEQFFTSFSTKETSKKRRITK